MEKKKSIEALQFFVTHLAEGYENLEMKRVITL